MTKSSVQGSVLVLLFFIVKKHHSQEGLVKVKLKQNRAGNQTAYGEKTKSVPFKWRNQGCTGCLKKIKHCKSSVWSWSCHFFVVVFLSFCYLLLWKANCSSSEKRLTVDKWFYLRISDSYFSKLYKILIPHFMWKISLLYKVVFMLK